MQFQTAMRIEFADSQKHQNEEWNKGFRAIRADVQAGIESVRDDVRDRSDALEKLFLARLDPVRNVAYGMVGMLMVILTGLLASGFIAGHTGK